jgi:hypothetical protein
MAEQLRSVHLRDSNALADIRAELGRVGGVRVSGVESRACFAESCAQLGTLYVHRDADADGLTRISSRPVGAPDLGRQAFTDSELAFHTDRSGVEEPPVVLTTYCDQPAYEGGVSRLADGKLIFESLARRSPDLLHDLLEPSSAAFGGAGSIITSSVFTQLATGKIMLRFRVDGLGYFRLSAAPAMAECLRVADCIAESYLLRNGEGYVVDNRRWLHSRTSFSGQRVIYRGLVSQLREAGDGVHAMVGGFLVEARAFKLAHWAFHSLAASSA